MDQKTAEIINDLMLEFVENLDLVFVAEKFAEHLGQQIGREINGLAHAITPNTSGPAKVGKGYVASLTESGIAIAEGLFKIAEAMQEISNSIDYLSEAVKESREK